jgi:hypothetical protein
MPNTKTTTPANTPTPASGFELLYKNVILADVARGTQSPQTCDVARLSDNRQVARFQRESVWHYHTFPADPRVASEFIASGENWTTRWSNELENLRIRSQTRALQMTTLQSDIAKYRAMFPSLADFQQLDSHRPSPAFSTGDVFVGILPPHGMLGIDYLWSLVDLHASGDFGTRGKFLSAPLTDEESFCVGLLQGERQNSASILTGNGIVRSEYVLSDVLQARYRDNFKIDPKQDSRHGVAVIWTLLSGGVGRSLVKIAPAGSEK